MVDTEDIRRKYLPEKIKTLFVGESALANGKFFYKGDTATAYTQKAFEKAYNRKFEDYKDFLSFFQAEGFYLDDLSLLPVDNLKKESERIAVLKTSITDLSKRLNKLSPDIIIIVLKTIKEYVFEAIGKSKLENVCIHVIPFPGQGHQNEYVDRLVKILKEKI